MLWIGCVLGFFIGGSAFLIVMKKDMISHYKVNGAFEEVEKAVKEVIPQQDGWGFPIAEWNIYESQLSKNLHFKNIKNMIIHFVCKPSIANRVLQVDPNMGGIMPCSWAVYETISGEVFIAKMNIPLMSKMYFGIVGKAMREVAGVEKIMLEKIQQKFPNQ